jgi:uncharacterized protein YuzE
MKLHYYPETDSLYIELKSAPAAETREIAEGLLVDFDAKGEVVGLDIDRRRKSSTSPRSRPLRFPQRPPRNDSK